MSHRPVVQAPSSELTGHLMVLSKFEDDTRWRVAEWVLHGLENGERVICGDPNIAAGRSWFAALLGEAGVATEAALAERRLLLMSLREFYPPEGQADLVDRALEEGYRGVRFVAWARDALGLLPASAYLSFEFAMERYCRTKPVASLCLYDRAPTGGFDAEGSAAAHFRNIQDDLLQIAESDGVLSLGGEADSSNIAVLRGALAAASSVTDHLVLDLTGLLFLGAAGYGAIVGGTEGLRDHGGSVTLLNPRPVIARVLRMLDVEQLAGVKIRTGLLRERV
jgi:anti-anti-sigma factor